MKHYSSIFPKTILILCLGLLLFFPSLTLAGAKSGLLLWFHTVLPTLFPFLVLSSLFVLTGLASAINRFLSPILCPLLSIHPESCYPVLIGLFSGYPLGAKTCADYVRSKTITKEEGQFLLSFCNNASPMFLLSYVSMQALSFSLKKSFLFLLVILLSAITSAFLQRKFFRLHHLKTGSPFADSKQTISTCSTASFSFQFTYLDEAISSGIEIITKVGGYIILFSVFGTVLQALPILPTFFRLLSLGILEITTGIAAIKSSGLTDTIKIILICAITAFGGLSSTFQTKSVTSGSGLSIRIYLLTKFINALIAAILSFVLLLVNIL